MKNKNVLISRFMIAACALSFAGTFNLLKGSGPEIALAAGYAAAKTAEFVAENKDAIQDVVLTAVTNNSPALAALIESLSEEFVTEYEAYRTGGTLNKVASAGSTYLWLINNKDELVKAAAMAGNSKNSIWAHSVARKFVAELDPLIKEGPMRHKLDAAKAYFWLRDHQSELTRVANGTASDFPDQLAQECVTVLSPLVNKQVLENNLDQAKTAFWVRKHKNTIIGVSVIGGVACLAAAGWIGYYLGSSKTAQAA